MDRMSWPIRLMAVMLVAPVLACAAAGAEAEVDIDAGAQPEQPSTMAPVTVQLEPMEGSNVAGEVMASHGPERVNVRVTQNGLTEGADYEAKLKYGMCSDAQMHFDQGLTADATRTDATGNHVRGGRADALVGRGCKRDDRARAG